MTLLSPRQKAFTHGDGLADNIWLLRSVVRDSQAKIRPLFTTFVDVSKAFDSVSRFSILKAAARLGVPDLLLSYIGSLYEDDTTRLKVKGRLGRRIRVRRGVRQGDPLSPVLFNAVMDLVLSQLDPSVGYVLDGTPLNHLAFADDVALLSQTKSGMVQLCHELETALASVGLRVNVSKSATLAIVADGSRKRWLCDRTPFVRFGGELVKSLDATQVYRYLGTGMGAKPRVPSVMADLEGGLRNLAKAPLKPQQRLRLLTDHLLPSLSHRLMLDERVPGSLMRDLDRKVRKSVRDWLHLPKDVPVCFFHSKVKDGGLGITQHTVQVRLGRRARIDSLVSRSLAGNDPALHWLVGNSAYLQSERSRLSEISSAGFPVTDVTGHKEAVAAGLYRTLDGRGLQAHGQAPNLSNWVRDDEVALSGRNFVGAIGIRAASLYTAGRASRGDRGSPFCDCCGAWESLGHIMQVCSKTWAIRNTRHNRIVTKLRFLLERTGYTVFEEPSIKTKAGLRKPDLVASRCGITFVIDVTVVSDNGVLDLEHERKVSYYDVPEIRDYVALRTGSDPSAITFSALALNWRGAMSRSSFNSLIQMGLNKRQCEVLVVLSLEQSFQIYLHSQRSTMRRKKSNPTAGCAADDPGIPKRRGKPRGAAGLSSGRIAREVNV